MVGFGATGVRPWSPLNFPELFWPRVRLTYRDRVSTGAWAKRVENCCRFVLLPSYNAGLMNRRHHMIDLAAVDIADYFLQHFYI